MGHSEELTIRRALGWLWRNTFSRRRRVQGTLVALYMLVGGLAELVTIGAISPLLAVFANPGGLSSNSRLGQLFAQFGKVERAALFVAIDQQHIMAGAGAGNHDINGNG